jgi:hypothetical protein
VRALVLSLCAAGCGTDLFALPFDKPFDFGVPGADLAGDGGGGGDDGGDGDGGGGGDLAGSDFTAPGLPASCAQLGCTPAMNEGDVNLDSGEVSGCHAYERLTISGVVTVGQSDGLGFAACANHIILGLSLSADGRGYGGSSGPGAGGTCGSGGGHGGKGADATGCSGGGTYDDMNLPRLPGSGGGSFGGGGGAGGGAIELAADDMQIIGIISASGLLGTGAVAGGGAGGSVLIHAGQLIGTGSVRAQGGSGLGLGGGGGGGRVAVYATTNAASLSYDVGGGDSMSGAMGASGTLVQP